MNILIKFPSRGRPEKFKSVIESYINLSSKKYTLNFICTFDNDDTLMNCDDIRLFLNNISNVQYFYRDSLNKIDAINANMENRVFDILILAADDLYPCVANYDEIIVNDMKKYHPDNDGILHYMNPNWEERLDIGCIMTYKYYKRFNFIYHPSYKSIFCDNEYMETAKILGKHIYIPDQIFNHHYVVSDPTANKNWQFNQEDESNYNYIKQNNFFLNT